MRLRRARPRRSHTGSGGGPAARIAGRPDHRAPGAVVGCVAGLVAFLAGLVAFLAVFFGGFGRNGGGAVAGCGSPSTLTLPSGWMLRNAGLPAGTMPSFAASLARAAGAWR